MDLALVQIDLYQELGESTQSETPESALQSERGILVRIASSRTTVSCSSSAKRAATRGSLRLAMIAVIAVHQFR